MWGWMLHDLYGVVNYLLLSLRIIDHPWAWLADPKLAMAYWGEAMTYTHPVWQQQDL